MGFFLLLLYLVASYLSPEELFPQLAPYRIVVWIAVAAVLASIPLLVRSQWLAKLSQTYLLLGLLGAMMFSEVAHLWFGGVLYVFQTFMPALIIFFLVCIHVNSWARLRILALVLSGVALELLAHTLWDLHTGNLISPYLMVMNPESASPLVRIRGVGYLNDPNDFAQFLLVVLPLVALAWANGKKLRNFFLVVIPCMALIYGVYLTRSRGALLALTVLAVILMSRRVPLWVSIFSGALLFVGMKVFGFTGGRDISVEAGSGRIDLWGAGLHMLRISPLWGVGYGRFMDFAPLTAHNSFILCMAEVGVLGYSCWLAALVVSFLRLNSLSPFSSNFSRKRDSDEADKRPDIKRAKNDAPVNSPTEPVRPRFEPPLPRFMDAKVLPEQVDKKEAARVRRWANTLRFSLIAFVVTGWFLSRTYTITLYVLLGMIAVLGQLAKDRPQEAYPRANWVKITLITEAASIVVLYVTVRISNLFLH